jgi:hypothetical protein
MLNVVLVWAGCATAAYLWLRAIVAPLVTAVRSYGRERGRLALLAAGLACAAALLWTIVPLAILLVAMMLEPRYGLALIATPSLRPGLVAGVAAWLAHAAIDRRLPRFGKTFEAASAVAIVAAVDDDPRTLGRVESLYRALAIDGSRKVNTAPPPGLFDACTSPPWRTTMARTIDRPRPLPEGTRVPAREASTL